MREDLEEAVRLHRKAADMGLDWSFDIEELTEDLLVIRGRYDKPGRIGGIIPGAIQMDMADTFAWIHTVARLPPGADAYTTDITVQFLRPLPVGQFVVRCQMLRWTPRRTVSSLLFSADGEKTETSATVSYAPRPVT